MKPAVEKLLALAAELVTARARVAELEAQVAALIGEGESKPPRAPRAKAPAPSDDAMSRGDRSAKIVELSKEGSGPKAIAEALGVPIKTVENALYFARKKGLLPRSKQ